MSHIVKLSKEEVRACADVALNRWMMKFGSIDRPNYAGDNKAKLEPEIAANVRSIVAEYAVAKLYKLPLTFPFYPNEEHSYRKDIADVGTNIEVKSVRTRDEIPVFPKDIRDGWVLVGARVLDRDYYSEVEVFGWLPMEDVQRDEWKYAPEGSWRVPLDEFKQEMLNSQKAITEKKGTLGVTLSLMAAQDNLSNELFFKVHRGVNVSYPHYPEEGGSSRYVIDSKNLGTHWSA